MLRSLKEDLSKSKKAKGDFQDNIEPFQQQDFVDFDNDPETETINLDDIKAVHPSSYNVSEEHEEIPEPLPSSEGYGGYGGYAALAQELSSEADPVPPIVDEKPQKKKRKPITLPTFSKRTILIAASIAGIAIVGASAYFLAPTVSGLFASHEADSSHVGEAKHAEVSHDKGHEKSDAESHHSTEEHHVDDKAITKIPDSLLNEIANDTKHSDDAAHDEHGASHGETHETVKNEAHSTEHKEVAAKAHTDEHPAAKHSEKERSPKHTDTHVQVNNNHSVGSSKSHDGDHPKKKTEHSHELGNTSHKSEAKHDAKETQHAVTRQHKKPAEEKVAVSKEKEEIVKQEQSTSASKEAKPLFTIQVYATPSKNEAERWLNKLRSVSAQSPVITTQSIRDKTWYRVRFGNFTSRDDAEKAIRNLGYDQCWIDRVR